MILGRFSRCRTGRAVLVSALSGCLSTWAGGALTIVPAPGFSITWDGNDGAHFDEPVPDNWALASRGALPIASGAYGPEVHLPYHLTSNINDGVYGNNASWIGGELDQAPWYAGVLFETPVAMTSIAFGRDNGNAAGEANQYADRSVGTYSLQYTADELNWTTIGSLTYTLQGDDGAPGAAFSSYLRHEFNVSTDQSAPIVAKGVRVTVSATGASGLALDELEVYGTPTPVPEPVSSSLTAALLAAWLLRLRLVRLQPPGS